MAIWLLPPVTWHAAGPTEGTQQVLVVRLIQKGMRLVICNPSPDRWTPAGFLTAWLCPAFDLLWSLAPLQLTNLAEREMPRAGCPERGLEGCSGTLVADLL